MRRIVSWFSCGAASAVATWLTLKDEPNANIVYCDTGSEHSDNKRFLRDCEKWWGKKVTVIQSVKYKNIVEVFFGTKFILSTKGAVCTGEMKKVPRFNFQRADDVQIFGYTYEEIERYMRFRGNNYDVDIRVPLVKAKLWKNDCLAIVERAGIRLPEMYRLGYKHNNCIGCVKGGAGYWNKIRVDFPYTFSGMAEVERKIGASVLKNGSKPLFLDELPVDAGRYERAFEPKCSLLCEDVLMENA